MGRHNCERPADTETDTLTFEKTKKPRVNQRAPIMIPPSSIAEIKTTNDVHTPFKPAAGAQTSNQQDSSPPDSASDGMEQDPIPGWDEMARTPKEREDANITNDLLKQAGRADPDPPQQKRTLTGNCHGDTRRERKQCKRRVSTPSKHLQPSRENSEGDDIQISPR